MAKSTDALKGRVRIIGGMWKKSVLHFPDVEGLRPTPDRVRETLFNWLGQDLTGLQCLDLYAGSGALGFEAASRGATRVVLMERNAEAVRALRANAARLSATSLDIGVGVLPRSGPASVGVLNPGSRVYVEAAEPHDAGRGWRELKRSRAGAVSYQLLEWNDDHSGLPGDV